MTELQRVSWPEGADGLNVDGEVWRSCPIEPYAVEAEFGAPSADAPGPKPEALIDTVTKRKSE